MAKIKPHQGKPYPLGSHYDGHGVNFACLMKQVSMKRNVLR